MPALRNGSMRTSPIVAAAPTGKAPTGIPGFDEITRGGLPRAATTLLEGGPGSGKTVMALQSLVNAARLYGEPGIFVAFEESSARIVANAAKFGWDLPGLQRKKLFFLDVQPSPDLIVSGSFDLEGMLAGLEAKASAMRTQRIVFDAVDVVLTLLNDPITERREVYRLHDWLLNHQLTAIITAKSGTDDHHGPDPFRFMQFMADCFVKVTHRSVEGISQRNLRVVKYRGSAYEENQCPFVIGDGGLEVAGTPKGTGKSTGQQVSTERVSSGASQLDAMLGGGYRRGSSVLITGFPGTAKTTVCGLFAEAACLRGEQTLFVSFDTTSSHEVVRDLSSVNIRLDRFVRSGVLSMMPARGIAGSAEVHLMRIKNAALAHRARCLVVDPVSALSKAGNEGTAHSVAERLIDWAKIQGITVLCSCLLDNAGQRAEGSPMQISTIADTWIHLSYEVLGGERNRGISVIKSRGTAHSNQVWEMILDDTGVRLAEPYTGGGGVLMGTMRWEREHAIRSAEELTKAAATQNRLKLEQEGEALDAQRSSLDRLIQDNRDEKALASHETATRVGDRAEQRIELTHMRRRGERSGERTAKARKPESQKARKPESQKARKRKAESAERKAEGERRRRPVSQQ
ncbi:MAG: circadian clock protein KaiC [Gemmatimonadota bacterium]